MPFADNQQCKSVHYGSLCNKCDPLFHATAFDMNLINEAKLSHSFLHLHLSICKLVPNRMKIATNRDDSERIEICFPECEISIGEY